MLCRADAPVVELDTIKASDAFGSGSSPDGRTIKTHAKGAYFGSAACVFFYVKTSYYGVFICFWT